MIKLVTYFLVIRSKVKFNTRARTIYRARVRVGTRNWAEVRVKTADMTRHRERARTKMRARQISYHYIVHSSEECLVVQSI